MKDAVFLKACRGEKTPYTPIWLMRQAGRYMKEYQVIRDRVSFLELCKTPDLACEVTVTAAEKLGVDAAIIFADILLITEPLGFHLEFEKGEGPVIANPFREKKDLKNMSDVISRESLSFVMDAILQTRAALKPEIPVIGFAGAPFTVASYVIEGGASKTFEKTKTIMRNDPELFSELLNRITKSTIDYISAQIEAGAEAIQLFDSWIGCLNPHEFTTHALPHSKRIFSSIPKNVPSIYFGTGTEAFLEDFANAGATVIGIDFHSPLKRSWKRIGDVAIQGNLDPTVLFSDRNVIKKEANFILKEAGQRLGHIFNLGHGIQPQTPVEHAKYLVDFVHDASS